MAASRPADTDAVPESGRCCSETPAAKTLSFLRTGYVTRAPGGHTALVSLVEGCGSDASLEPKREA